MTQLNLSIFHTIVFDFDGVFTDNKVFIDGDGCESVRCSRGDGLGLDLLRAYISINNLEIKTFILTRESAGVVMQRARKIKLNCFPRVQNKKSFLDEYFYRERYYDDNPYAGLIYLGNDLNDLEVMSLAGYSVAPIDSHAMIIKCANLVINKAGGDGFVREFIELAMDLNNMEKEFIYELINNCGDRHKP
jgi:YrbI family 3-deoxy-D-manno-octulosonate 8-phosphate phosphatase